MTARFSIDPAWLLKAFEIARTLITGTVDYLVVEDAYRGPSEAIDEVACRDSRGLPCITSVVAVV